MDSLLIGFSSSFTMKTEDENEEEEKEQEEFVLIVLLSRFLD